MKITKADVLHVADLARLEIADQDIALFSRQLGSILEYVEILKTVDTQDVPPTTHAIQLTNAFREDEVTPHLDLELVMANAPEKDQDGFRVPRIIG